MLVIAIAAGIVYIYFTCLHEKDGIAAAEDILIEQECRVAWLPTRLDDGVAMISYTLDTPPRNAGFYLRNRAESKAILLQQNGDSAAPREIRIYRTRIVGVSASGSVSRIAERDGWELFEIMPPQHEPSAQRSAANQFHLRDGFTRVDFAKDDGWKVVSGNWQLNKHGGGLPTTDEQFESAAFQRAVNPFSLLGSGDGANCGLLLYDAPGSRSESYLAEARFYIGQAGPNNRDIVQHAAIPPFLIAQGNLDGVQIAFGWWNAEPNTKPNAGSDAGTDNAPSWMLCRRSGDEPWETLASWQHRPPRTNWVRVGIAIHEGHIAAAYLDGHELGRHDLGQIVSGPLHIHTGTSSAFIELDDILARPPTTAPGEELGEPILGVRLLGTRRKHIPHQHGEQRKHRLQRPASRHPAAALPRFHLSLHTQPAGRRLPILAAQETGTGNRRRHSRADQIHEKRKSLGPGRRLLHTVVRAQRQRIADFQPEWK